MHRHRETSSPAPSVSLLDALYLMVAGAMFEVQTRGAVRPFDLQRRTLRALSHRPHR